MTELPVAGVKGGSGTVARAQGISRLWMGEFRRLLEKQT